jgi:hypothetical protein
MMMAAVRRMTDPEDMLEVVLGEEQVHGALSEAVAAARRHAEAAPEHTRGTYVSELMVRSVSEPVACFQWAATS